MIIATFSGVRMIHNDQYQIHVRRYTSAFSRNIKQIADVQEKSQLASQINKNIVVVGRDGREVSQLYVDHVLQVLVDHGFKPLYVDTVPTPTVQQLVQLKHAVGGIVITASHNPGNWCGLKFLGPSSLFLSPDECQIVYGDLQNEEAYDNPKPECDRISSEEAIKIHVDHVLKSNLVKVQQIRDCNFKIAFNGMCASGNAYIPYLAEVLNLQLLRYNSNIGPLPQKPEPTPQNLQDFKDFIQSQKSTIDVGFAVDPDADRCVIVDQFGEPVLEELTLSLCVEYVLSQSAEQFAVKNCSSSMSNDVICRSHGAKIIETAVGEVNVALRMRELNARIGGEGNGGVILSDAHLGRDSIVAICLILSYMAVSHQPISTLVNKMPKFTVIKEKYEFDPENRSNLLLKMEQLKSFTENHPNQFRILTVDGVKLIYDEKLKWVHVRFSNTEPIVRIIAEAQTENECRELIKKVEDLVFK
ncbi:Phosphoglucosamine_mutase [Hexamita inflata]|uniref:Phosphoglucosamine mutase n=1 Tax=Hexamita inflata TaxID=28002 RepID=A0AA86U858_9EUKA|nr:Phosphoglucosamine mutase [Hexamita inflata]